MSTNLIRKSLELSPEQWHELNRQAEQFELSPGVGPTPKKPSWRILIREIATGNIILSRKETDND